ncbi:TonB-dependent receptor plug domain-containing protein [Sphingomonas lenta]|uniref:TonB-dependent receptor n=1 Tax=Sphingomonas lenta TaxID=1141887 RepID=A0A2A2SHF4_9SPHN|nr:TonB-dependent receptor [Sphingomonas lenta]PAX08600.1 hypothetical protein CKY28_04285 [Sphingomonas lenta]
MRSTMLATFLAGTALATPAHAQTAPSGTAERQLEQDAPDTTGDDPSTEVVVTGSRIAGRTIADSPVPVDVIGGEQLTNAGQTELNRVLTQQVPSFNFPQPSLTDGTDSTRPATLRGLAPDQTLVLVNGRRRHQAALLNLNGSVGRGSGAVDLNQIIPIAIDRIEVLRDGASSLYGSDAIAGVVNIQLSRREGVRANVTYGRNETRMDDVDQVTGVATGANGLPVVAVAGGGNGANDLLQLTTTGRDRKRSDGATTTVAASIGLPVGEDAHLVFSGQFRDRQPTDRSGPDPRRQYFVGDPRELSVDRYNHRYGDGEVQDYNLFANAGYQLGAVELYAFGSLGVRDGDGAGFFRRPNDARNRDFAASTTTFVPFYPDGFLPFIESEIEDYSIAAGARTTLGGWNADLSAVYGTNRQNFAVRSSFNTSLGGVASPRRFDAGGIAFGQVVANLDVSRTFEVGFLDQMGVAVGFEYRDENFRIFAGEPASYVNGPFTANGAPGGAQVFPGFRPSNEVDVSRDSYAAYVELSADVSDRLSFQAAGRYERYSDFGDTMNGKLAGRFELFEGAALRGSISTGFRAPSLQQQFFNATSTNNVNGVLIDIRTAPVSDAVSVALGSQPLDPERALNLGGGVTLNPVPGFTVTADYYNIRIRDRIVLTENLQGAAVNALLLANGITGVSSARFFVNGVDTRTEGVDVVATYRVPDLGVGNFRLTAGFNYNEQRITDRATLPSLPGLVLFARQESFRITNGQPRSKILLAADYDRGPVSATVRTNRYGSVFVAGTSTNPAVPIGAGPADYFLEPKWITDAEVRIRPVRALELAVGADNIFDVYPTRAPAGGAFGNNNFFLPYSSLSPFGFNGRFHYARLGVEL